MYLVRFAARLSWCQRCYITSVGKEVVCTSEDIQRTPSAVDDGGIKPIATLSPISAVSRPPIPRSRQASIEQSNRLGPALRESAVAVDV